jgi:hypothetical protein
MAALVRQLALVSESNSAGMSDLLRVSAALQKQASRDLAPIWELSATVDAFAKLEDVPDGYWPMIIKDDIGVEAAGVHKDKDGQPFALIASSPDFDNWALNCSHEMLEMLVDPSLDWQVTGDSPMDGQGRVSFLVEVCDPSGAADFGYSVNGILMSDFYTPHFFDPVASAGVRYSFTGAITGPRQVLRGGYLSWKEPATGHLWQQVWFRGAVPTFRDLGSVGPQHASLRSFVDRFTAADTAKALARGRKRARAAGLTEAVCRRSSVSNAEMWQQQINEIMGRSSRRSPPPAAARGRRAKRHR